MLKLDAFVDGDSCKENSQYSFGCYSLLIVQNAEQPGCLTVKFLILGTERRNPELFLMTSLRYMKHIVGQKLKE